MFIALRNSASFLATIQGHEQISDCKTECIMQYAYTIYSPSLEWLVASKSHLCSPVEADLDGSHSHGSCAGVDEDLLALGHPTTHDHGVVGSHVGGGHGGRLSQAPAVGDDPGQVLAGSHLCGQRILGGPHDPGVCALLQSSKQV